MRRSFLLAPFVWALPIFSGPVHAQKAEIPPSLMEHGVRLLAALIRSARENAIANGVRPMPPRMYSALLGYFPDRILRKVRYASGQADGITIPGLAMTYGHIDAVALADVVMFREDQAARTDSKLWAHELTHVMQYERWGVEGFVRRYLQNYDAIEKEARDNTGRFVSWSEHAHL